MKNVSLFSAALLVTLSLISCTANKKDSGSSAGIPAIQPPVSKATPSGLSAATLAGKPSEEIGTFALTYTELQQRFYAAGPTKIENLLKAVDDRMAEINTRSAESEHTCLSASPVEYSMTILGAAKTVYFQCYDIMGDGSGGILFGKKDNVWYLYQNIGAGRSLAIVTPVTDSAGDYVVETWFSVGVTNSPSWHSGSYGVVHLKANSATKVLEMVVAGTGFGYCGAQLKTDGTNLFLKGAAGGGYNGSAWTCSAVDTACQSATNLSQAGTCTAVDQTSFELASFGSTNSGFGTTITLDGTATDAVHFGPAVSAMSGISGVSAF